MRLILVKKGNELRENQTTRLRKTGDFVMIEKSEKWEPGQMHKHML